MAYQFSESQANIGGQGVQFSGKNTVRYIICPQLMCNLEGQQPTHMRWEQPRQRIWENPQQQWDSQDQFQPQPTPPMQAQPTVYPQTQTGPQVCQYIQHQSDQHSQAQQVQNVQLQHAFQENQHYQQDQELGLLLHQQPSPQLTALDHLFYEMVRLNPVMIPLALQSREVSRALGWGTTM